MKVLIVVDMQKGFLNKEEYNKLEQSINKLIKLQLYDKYIFTKFINKNNSMYEKWIGWKGLSDEKSQEIVVEIPENSIIFNKTGYGLSQEQLQLIKNLKVSQVDICGVQSDACVYAISLQLWDNGIFPNILANYIGTHNSNDMAKIFEHQFGKVDKKEL